VAENPLDLHLRMLLDLDGVEAPGNRHLAERLAVTPRTIQRWRTQEQRPGRRVCDRLCIIIEAASARLGPRKLAKWQKQWGRVAPSGRLQLRRKA